jgi:hypothetical protein
MGCCIYADWKRYDRSSERQEGSTRRRKKLLKTFDGSGKRYGEKDILLVLDANEYIFGLSELKDTSAKLLDVLPLVEGLKVVVPSTVLDEATRNPRYIHSILVTSSMT